jgi:hypothetical protein
MMPHWMFSCREVSQRVSRSLDDHLPLPQRILVWLHLKMCRYCARFRGQLAAIRRAIEQLDRQDPFGDPRIELPAQARERIKRALQSL